MSRFILCIEGTIGAGKSSLMQRLATRFQCFPEPLSEWTLLTSFYQNPTFFAFPLQLQILLSQFQQYQRFPEEGLVLVERCPWTSRHVFSPLILTDTDLALYESVYQRLTYPVHAFLYLDLEPEVAFQRLQQRTAMDRAIPLAYLHRLQTRYTSALKEGCSNVWIVDANRSLEVVEQDVLTKIASIFPDGLKTSLRPNHPPSLNDPLARS